MKTKISSNQSCKAFKLTLRQILTNAKYLNIKNLSNNNNS